MAKLRAIGQQAGTPTEEEQVLLNVLHAVVDVDLQTLEM
jgi:hypothetical protein